MQSLLHLPLYNRTPVVSISQTKSNPNSRIQIDQPNCEFEIPIKTFRRSRDEDVTISGTGNKRRLVLPIIMSIWCLCGSGWTTAQTGISSVRLEIRKMFWFCLT
ncbi:hypothetical protein Hanom_Chr17g01572281 [Helianthus anomalus]